MNKKQLIVATMVILIILSFLAGYYFSNQFNRSYHKSIVGAFGKTVYVAMNKPSFPYGRMTLTRNEISWVNGKRSKYIVTEDSREYCVIELITTPLSVFHGITAQYIIFSSLEPWREFELIGTTIANSHKDIREGRHEWFSLSGSLIIDYNTERAVLQGDA